MALTARILSNQPSDEAAWDRFVTSSDDGTVFHLLAWRRVVHEVFRHAPHYLLATDGEDIQLMVRNVGEGSNWLVHTRPGDELDCIGPQGRGFRLEARARNILMVGGGYGVAPLVGLAERAIARGMSIALAVGAATATHV